MQATRFSILAISVRGNVDFLTQARLVSRSRSSSLRLPYHTLIRTRHHQLWQHTHLQPQLAGRAHSPWPPLYVMVRHSTLLSRQPRGPNELRFFPSALL